MLGSAHLGGSARSSAHCTLVRRMSMAGRMVFFSSSIAVRPRPEHSMTAIQRRTQIVRIVITMGLAQSQKAHTGVLLTRCQPI